MGATIALLAGSAAAQPCSPEWGALGAGLAGGPANDLVVFNDGNGPAIYVGGGFNNAGGAPANRIARWDGQAWSTLGTGVNLTIIAMTLFDDGGGLALYAGGVFTTPATRIAKWDGQSWSPLGSGASSNVQALTVFNDGTGPALYAGGVFINAGGLEVNRVARWNGQAWSQLGIGVNGTIQHLMVFDDGTGAALYACGFFTEAGGVPGTAYLARWNGQAWSGVGTGVDGVTRAIGAYDDGDGPALYAAIDWYAIPTGVPTSRVAKWDGESWSEVGPSPSNGSIVDFAVFDDGTGGGPALYAAGTFTSVGGLSANRIAKWNGEVWSPLGSGITGGGNVVNSLAIFDQGAGPALFAAGGFATAGPIAASRIALWQGCPPAPTCYPNCDDSTQAPILNVADFGCFLTKYAAGDPYANCDDSTQAPVLNVADFGCFLTRYAAGCP
ncbi:MAG: hypothetical protein WD749_05220 [Phycisphaerales bacterium]